MYAGVLGMLTISFLIVTMVIIRQLGGAAWGFMAYISLLLLATGGLSLAYTQKRKGHISLGIILDRLSPKFRVFLSPLWWLSGILILIVILMKWIPRINIYFKTGQYVPGSIPMPVWPFWTAFAVGVTFLLIWVIVHFTQSIKEIIKMFHKKSG